MTFTTAGLTGMCSLIVASIVFKHEMLGRSKGDATLMTMQSTDNAGISIEERLTPITGPRELARPAIGPITATIVATNDGVFTHDSSITWAAAQHERMLDDARTANYDRVGAPVEKIFTNPTGKTRAAAVRPSTVNQSTSLFEQGGSIFEDSARYGSKGSIFKNYNSHRAHINRLGSAANARAAARGRDRANRASDND